MKRKSFPPHPSILRKEENIYILYYIYIIKRKIYKKKKFSFFDTLHPPRFWEKIKIFREGRVVPSTGYRGGWVYCDAANVIEILCTPQQRPLLIYSMLYFRVFRSTYQKYAKIKRFKPLLMLRYVIYHFSK